MAFKTFGSLNLPGRSDPEPFHRPSSAFYLRHVCLLRTMQNADCKLQSLNFSFCIFQFAMVRYFGVNNIDMFLPSNLGEMSSLATSWT